jgi:antitoxin VapB
MKTEHQEVRRVYTLEYIPGGDMQTAKIFMNGKSQAVRLPKEFRFEGEEVFIKKVGDTVVLMPKENHWERWIRSWGKFSDDFMSDRNQPPTQEREGL